MKEDPLNKNARVLDMDDVEWVKYQFALKRHIEQEGQFEDNMQKIFNIILE